MSDDQLSTVKKSLKKLQDADKEKELFDLYGQARSTLDTALRREVRGEAEQGEVANAVKAEERAFDDFVRHRQESTFRKQ